MRAAVTPRTRLLIINSPHNPDRGRSRAGRHPRARGARRRDATSSSSATRCTSTSSSTAIQHESMARHAELAARSFIIGSFGKTYHTTGWKVGYAVAPAALTEEFRKVHQFVTFSTHTPVQYALADFLADRRGLAELSPFYQAKRDLFLRLMEGSRFRPLPCRGSYFQLMDYSAITADDDADFAVRLTKEHGVASIPTSPFLYRSAGAARAPLLLREEGRDAGAGGGASAGRSERDTQALPTWLGQPGCRRLFIADVDRSDSARLRRTRPVRRTVRSRHDRRALRPTERGRDAAHRARATDATAPSSGPSSPNAASLSHASFGPIPSQCRSARTVNR